MACNTGYDVRGGDILDPMARPPIRFTRTDYEQLPEHIRAELIEGDLLVIPAPTPWHETLAERLHNALTRHLGMDADNRVRGCQTEVSAWDKTEESIILPDLVVFPEGTEPTGRDWKTPTPVWVAEVLSPSTAGRDRGVKLRLYARAGIKEAWLVDPEAETIEVHDLERKSKHVSAAGTQAESKAIPGFRVDVAELFAVGG